MPGSRQFTIGQLAREVEIPASTVRYYERIGLLVPEDRSHGNYRLYSQASLRRLHFIRAAQSIGFTLDDIELLLGAQDGKTPSCQKVQGLIEDRLSDIGTRLKNLRQVQRLLRSSLQKCRGAAQPKCCHVIELLEATSLR
jgi:MerR family mercuric resistance operon transcriptional regulator